jgi:hypothetical protein
MSKRLLGEKKGMAITERWTVIGIFEDQGPAYQAMDDLLQAGFTDEQIGFAVRDSGDQGDGMGGVSSGIIGGVLGVAEALLTPVMGPSVARTVSTTATPVAEEAVVGIRHVGTDGKEQQTETDNEQQTASMEKIDVASEEPVTTSETKIKVDGATGAMTGGIVGGVLGAAVALLLPAFGPVFAGGMLVAVLGSAALGAMTGGFIGAFIGMGVPEEHARHYEHEFSSGRTIVTVKTDDHQQDAINILHEHGALYVNAHDRV